MAAIDLLQNAYREHLGRDASEQELQGWTSGQFGGGSVNDWVNQIANSGEAQARRPSHGPQTPQEPVSHGYDQPASGGGNDQQDFFGALGNAYTQYLGRSATPDELNNWWSGNYGYGQGWSGFNQMREAIRTSGEAKARNNGAPPSAYYQDLAYWKGQGVNESDIFDFTTGQPKPGWQRTAQGYSRTGGSTGGSTIAPPNGNFESWFMQLTNGKTPTPEMLESLAPELAKYGIRIGSKGNRGWSDTIILPDGRMYDVIEAAGINSGKNWVWQQNGGPGYVATPEDQYSDPYTKLLEQLLKSRFTTDPNRQANIGALQNRAAQLQTGNAQLNQQMDYLQKRFTELQGSGYTGAENEVIRTSALDPIEMDRTQAQKMLANKLAAKGHRPGSGVYEAAMLELNKNFDAMRGSTQTQLAGNELARRENRNQRAEAISGELARIPEERSRELLDVMNAIDRLSRLTATEEDAYARELAGLGPERLQLAMQAAGMGSGNTSSLGSLLTQIAGMNQNANAYNASNSNAMWSGLGQLAAIIGRQNQFGLGG